MAYRAGSSVRLTISFYDFDGVAEAPVAATYTVCCATTRQIVRAATPISPLGATVVIVLTGTDTAIQDAANDLEVKTVFIDADYGGGDTFKDEISVEVVKGPTCS